jgi:proteasome lid subunit RPN8/RPN11
MPVLEVVVDHVAERGFRRRALARMPNEYIERLWGFVDQDGVGHVRAFRAFRHTADRENIYYEQEDYDLDWEEGRARGWRPLGSIHTHPFLTDTAFSEADLRGSLEVEDIVMGICAIECPAGKRRVVRIDYWPKVRPLERLYCLVSSRLKVTPELPEQ